MKKVIVLCVALIVTLGSVYAERVDGVKVSKHRDKLRFGYMFVNQNVVKMESDDESESRIMSIGLECFKPGDLKCKYNTSNSDLPIESIGVFEGQANEMFNYVDEQELAENYSGIKYETVYILNSDGVYQRFLCSITWTINEETGEGHIVFESVEINN